MSYYRNVYTIEVLSDEILPDLSLADIDYEITEGHCSGSVTREVQNDPVSEERMRELLIAQGSDPSFLIPEEEDDDDPAN